MQIQLHSVFHVSCHVTFLLLGCIEETCEPVEGHGESGGGLGHSGGNHMDAKGGLDDEVTQEELNLTCFNLMIDVLNSQMELQVNIKGQTIIPVC